MLVDLVVALICTRDLYLVCHPVAVVARSSNTIVSCKFFTFCLDVPLRLKTAKHARQKLTPGRSFGPLSDRQIVVVGPLDEEYVGDEDENNAVQSHFIV